MVKENEHASSEFGQFLKEMRRKKGLTLIEFGELVGLSNPYLSQIENGRRGIPAADILEKFANVLDIPFVVLLDKAWRIKSNTPIIQNDQLFNYDLSNLLYYKDLNFKGHVLTQREREGIERVLNALFPDNDNHSWFEDHLKSEAQVNLNNEKTKKDKKNK